MHERRLKWKTWEDFTYLRTYNLEGAIEEFRNFDANLFLNQIYFKLEKKSSCEEVDFFSS